MKLGGQDHIVLGLRSDVTCCTECRYKNNQKAADLIESQAAKIERVVFLRDFLANAEMSNPTPEAIVESLNACLADTEAK